MQGAKELRGVHLGVAPTGSGTGVALHVCVHRTGKVSAGRYEGDIRIYGPTVKQFDYPVAVTAKDKKGVAIALLLGGIVVAIGVAGFGGSLLVTGKTRRRTIIGGVLGVLVMVGAGLLVYFSVYDSNAVWGADRAKDFAAIAVGGFTSASAGLVAIHAVMQPLKK